MMRQSRRRSHGEAVAAVPPSLSPRLRARRRRRAAHPRRRPGVQRRRRRSRCSSRPRRRAPSSSRFPELGLSALHLRRPVPPAGAARRLRGGARARRRGDGADPRRSRSSACRCASTSCLYNCAAVVARGRVLGVVPKTYLPNYREFYEVRQFQRRRHARCRRACRLRRRRRAVRHRPDLRDARPAAAADLRARSARTCGCRSRRRRYAALAGATVLVNLSASNITIGKADYRHRLVGLQSARCLAAYLYSSAGLGESTTDLGLGRPGADLRERHAARRIGALRHRLAVHQRRRRPRARLARAHAPELLRPVGRAARGSGVRAFRRVPFELPCRREFPLALQRKVERFPYVPADPATRDERCKEVYNIQVQALLQRLPRESAARSSCIGISGGLDSTQALLVCARGDGRAGAAAEQHPRLHDARLRHQRRARSTRPAADGAVGCTAQRDRHPAELPADARRTSAIPYRAGRARSTTSRSRTCRPASAPATCSGSPTSTAASWSAPAICPSSRSAGAPTASATTCRTTTSTRACRRR